MDRVVRFDDFEFDRHTLELRKGSEAVRLQQQPARVLAVLTENAGDLVLRETLRTTIWGDDTFVDFDRGLNYCINQIRTALGDTADAPRYLETLRGRGYRFIGRIERPAPPRRARILRPVSFAAAAVVLLVFAFIGARYATAQRDAIGVAPMIAPPEEREWSAALHAQIVSRLSAASRTPVIDLTRSAAKTRWRVEGRVDRSAEQYRVTMLLRDTRDGSVPWSDIFAGAPGDWVDAQSEMAQRMTEIIRYRIEGPRAGLPMRRQKLPPSRSMKR
jgi:DNA-binding winged helix-turn-helix (wHTH) protein